MEDHDDETVWQNCSVNCGSRCALRLHVRDGKLRWVESDTLPETDGAPQMRACARGRSLRFWLDAPERLNRPLRRLGPRGSGVFEPISWDDALDEVADRIKRTVETWGNEAVYISYGTGLHPIAGSPFERLMNCYGGFLGRYGDYSCAQLQTAFAYTFGDDGYYTGSVLGETEHSDLVLLFGNSPADTRMGGAGAGWEFLRARERGNFKLVSIDPRHTETMAGHLDEWIPLRPGTDAALVAGLAYVLITEGLVDHAFLDRYCIGYDRSTLPASAPENASYRDYILGTGPDGVAKTPAWACAITGVPERRIVSLAREIAYAKALFVTQGWGPQRHDMGELTARAIPMLAILTGNVGLPGTNSGARERFLPFTIPEDPIGENPVKTAVPVFEWCAAVEHGTALTSRNAGVRGADALKVPIKLIISHAGNCLTNQHADINHTHDVLSDESLCEFIVASDVQMTDSAKYADIVLPDIARAEQANVVSSGSADMVRGVVRGSAWKQDHADRRTAEWVCAQLADRLGVREAFDAIGGKSRVEVDEARVREGERMRDGGAEQRSGEMPTYDQLADRGLWRIPYTGPRIAYEGFRRDLDAHPLGTPSGKIEIYSERLAELAETLEYDDDQVVDPLPVYAQSREGYGSPLQERFPFQLIGYHSRQHTHSTFANVRALEGIAPTELEVNPIDAAQLGIVQGERVAVENDRGTLVASAHITPRIMPGVLALPQGAWHRARMDGDRVDYGACINTLTSTRPTPLARGNAQHTNLVRVRKLVFGEAREPLAGAAALRGEGAPHER